MHLGRLGYYADFLIHPLIVLAGIAFLSVQGSRQRLLGFLAVGAGLFVWTILEYGVHRLLFHGAGYFARMHGVHHRRPLEMFGTPSWVSLAILLVGIFGPGCFFLGFAAGSGFTIGISVGFFWYITVHHAIHYWPMPQSAYLRVVRRHHERHHYAGRAGNFGVTTPLWDLVMRSVLPDRDKSRRIPR